MTLIGIGGSGKTRWQLKSRCSSRPTFLAASITHSLLLLAVHLSEVIAIYNGTAAVDPEAAAELSQALEGRWKGMETFAFSLEPHLRPGLDVARAAAILRALCLPEVFYELVEHSGWLGEDY